MKPISPDTLALVHTRRAALVTLVGTVSALAILTLAVLVPLRRTRGALAREIAGVEADLMGIWKTPGRQPLHVQADLADLRCRQLEQEWAVLQERAVTFKGQLPYSTTVSNEQGRINFKVALFESRTRLRAKAEQRGAALPADLGIPETIDAAEDAETRFRQLAVTTHLLDTLLDTGVPVVQSITPLAPVTLAQPRDTGMSAQEFPVRVMLRCPFEKLLSVLETLGRERTFFAVRGLRVERLDREVSDPLRVELTAGALVYTTARLDEVGPPPPEREMPVGAGGGTGAEQEGGS
jgi:hypothetical protein